VVSPEAFSESLGVIPVSSLNRRSGRKSSLNLIVSHTCHLAHVSHSPRYNNRSHALKGFIMRRTALTLICGVALLCGCGGGESGGYSGPLGTVTGKITFEGKPVPEGSQVLFMAPATGYSATGVVDAAGKYTLKYNASDKIPAVKYAVQIAPPAAPTASVDPSKMTPPAKTQATPFPVRYGSTAKSKLEFTVVEGQNTATFDLTK
jgi:hypothetical protein